MNNQAPNTDRVIPLRTSAEPLWRDLVGEVLRRERRAQGRTLKDVSDAARVSVPYLSEVERGRKEASSEVLAAAAHALGLGLGDLLARAQRELAPPPAAAPARLDSHRCRPARPAAAPSRRSAPSATSAAPYRGLALAA
ncbi:helix-turn-helix domain-containing protein [Streptomyces sp. NPDC101166]|uniref:helix-turn-helix domain-containing protein n=1 Tax=Streptomyces sp. NPDC101166 TaxID=3366120 RepID=UPI0038160145